MARVSFALVLFMISACAPTPTPCMGLPSPGVCYEYRSGYSEADAQSLCDAIGGSRLEASTCPPVRAQIPTDTDAALLSARCFIDGPDHSGVEVYYGSSGRSRAEVTCRADARPPGSSYTLVFYP